MEAPLPEPALDPLALRVRAFYEDNHAGIARARKRRAYYYGYLARVVRARVPAGQRVLDLGCGAGEAAGGAAAVEVGIDLSRRAIREGARAPRGASRYATPKNDASDPAVLAPGGGPFDVILLVNVVTH